MDVKLFSRPAPLLWAVILLLCLGCANAKEEESHKALRPPFGSDLNLDVRDDAAGRMSTIRLGPLSLPAYFPHAEPPSFYFHIPFDGWLIGYRVRVVDEGGIPLPGHLLHHVILYRTAGRDFLCPQDMEYFHATGSEMTNWPDLPGAGYPVVKGQRIRLDSMFHNPTATAHSQVYLELRLTYRLKAEGPPLKNIELAWFWVTGCGPPDYDLPTGGSLRMVRYTMPRSGVLIALGGHLHQDGLRLRLENISRRETIATIVPNLDAQGRIASVPLEFFGDRGGSYRLNRGEVVRVSVSYDNRADKLLPKGAMGLVLGFFVPDEEADPPGQE